LEPKLIPEVVVNSQLLQCFINKYDFVGHHFLPEDLEELKFELGDQYSFFGNITFDDFNSNTWPHLYKNYMLPSDIDKIIT
jgi:hypothetical protein